MIIWLASYPKSGNTWVRSIITSILFSKDGNINNFELLDKIDQYPTKKYFKDLINNFNNGAEIQKNWINSQKIINKDKKIRFFKTHHLYCKYGDNAFTDSSNTLGVIHIVRDPRNLVSSLKHHWSLKNNNEAMDKLLDNQTATGLNINESKEYSFPVMISSWKNHYNSWKKIKKNYLLIKYEDIVKDPESQLINIINYLKKFSKIDISTVKTQNILKTTSFENFKKLENKGFFKESNLNQLGKLKTFFNEGPNSNWRNFLNSEISSKIEKEFNVEMKELKYL
tara:strand:- start:231 stop:1076 length:846 start_codon:yes stop_codon:yes gene_type:complete